MIVSANVPLEEALAQHLLAQDFLVCVFEVRIGADRRLFSHGIGRGRSDIRVHSGTEDQLLDASGERLDQTFGLCFGVTDLIYDAVERVVVHGFDERIIIVPVPCDLFRSFNNVVPSIEYRDFVSHTKQF